jgi:hypothetical protein
VLARAEGSDAGKLDPSKDTHTHAHRIQHLLLVRCPLPSFLACVQEAFRADDLTHDCCFVCQQEAWRGCESSMHDTHTHTHMHAACGVWAVFCTPASRVCRRLSGRML